MNELILDLCNKTQNNKIVWCRSCKYNPPVFNIYKCKKYTLTEFFGTSSNMIYTLEYKPHWYSRKRLVYGCCDDLRVLCGVIESALLRDKKRKKS